MEKQILKKQTKQLLEGIILEKYQEKTGTEMYYVLNLTLKKFKKIKFTVDLTGSINIGIKKDNLIYDVELEPFSTKEIARFLLNKKWKVKTKFKYILEFPSYEMQYEMIQTENQKMITYYENNKKLKMVDGQMMSGDQMEQYLLDNNLQYLDYGFVAGGDSLGYSEQKQKDVLGCLVQWRDGREVEEEAELFGEIQQCDLNQGKMKDQWMVGVMGCLAQNPEYVKRLFMNQNNKKFQEIKLGSMGEWEKMKLDYYFPCAPQDKPIFANSNSGDMWVLFLQKAYAKQCGSYENLKFGKSEDAFVDLTGCPTFKRQLADYQSNQDYFYQQLQNQKQQGYIVSLGTDKSLEQEGVSFDEETLFNIIQLKEINNKKLINIKNNSEQQWQGRYYEDSSFWTNENLNENDIQLDDEDNIWIDMQEMNKYFQTIYICYVKGWQESRIKSKFIMTVDKNNSKITHFCSRYFYKINLEKKSKVIFGLHQQDVKKSFGQQYLDIGIQILKLEGGKYLNVNFVNQKFERQTFLEQDLEAGEYYVVPKSIGISLKYDNKQQDYVMKSEISNDQKFNYFCRQLFNKYDHKSNKKLDYDQFGKIYKILVKDLSENEFNNLLKKYNKQFINNDKFISQDGFIQYMIDLFNNNKNKREEYLQKLGYNQQLVSERSRIYNFTIHSDEIVKIEIQDALEENVDFICNELLIKQFGKRVSDDDDKVYSMYYEHKELQCYSYGVVNSTIKNVKASLDLSKSNKMVHNLKDSVVSKSIESDKIEFMIHSQPEQYAEKIYRDAKLEYKIIDQFKYY